MALRPEACRKLEESFTRLRTAMSYIHCYGMPKAGTQDAFDLGLINHINQATEIAEWLSALLLDAQLDSQIHDLEVLREARRSDTPKSDAQLWKLCEWLHAEIEKRRGPSVVQSVERGMLYHVLGAVTVELNNQKE